MKKVIQSSRVIFQAIATGLFMAGMYIAFKKYMFLATIPLMLILGPVFCSWLCPFGAIQRATAWLGKKLLGKHFNSFINIETHTYLKWGRYALALVLIVIPIVFNFSVNALLTWFLYGGLILSLTIERFYCKYLCKDGAIYSLFNLLKLKKIKRTSHTCVSCGKCDRVCPMNISISTKAFVGDITCISCYKCVNTCPIEDTLHTNHHLNNKWLVTTLWLIPILLVGALVFAGQQLINTSSSEDLYDESNDPSSSGMTHTASTTWIDGVYEATVRAYHPNMNVQVTITNGHISDIQIPSHHETRGYYEYAFKVIPEQIIASQSTNVDVVSGATYTSLGIIDGVNKALKDAVELNQLREVVQGSLEEMPSTNILESTENDNFETPFSESEDLNIIVESNHVESQPESQPIEVILEDPIETTDHPPLIEGTNTPVTGEGITTEIESKTPQVTDLEIVAEPVVEVIEPLAETIVEPVIETQWIDGVYTATVRAYRPNMQVQTTIKDDQILDIQIVSHHESRGYYERAFEQIPASIINTQSTKVDTVSGATYTSEGIIRGVEEALSQALR